MGLESGRPSYETCAEQVWTFPSDLLVRRWIAAERIYCFWAARLTELTSGFYFSLWCHTPLGDNSRLSNPRPATAACCWAGFSQINTLDCVWKKRTCCKIMKSTLFQGIFCDDSGRSRDSGQVLAPHFPLRLLNMKTSHTESRSQDCVIVETLNIYGSADGCSQKCILIYIYVLWWKICWLFAQSDI